MGTIAHVLEAAGLATVMLASVRGQVERLRPPRALYCEFPMGRPLGKPGDPAFQRRVMESALELLGREIGPVLEDFPDSVADGAATPLSCTLPPRHDESLAPEVDEALGLRKAWERGLEASGRTLVGRAVGADEIPRAIEAFLAIKEGASWKEQDLTGHPLQWARDITSYYEEAAGALVDHTPAARSAESWFYQSTKTGALLKDARRALKDRGEPYWFYLIPFTQDLEAGRPGSPS